MTYYKKGDAILVQAEVFADCFDCDVVQFTLPGAPSIDRRVHSSFVRPWTPAPEITSVKEPWRPKVGDIAELYGCGVRVLHVHGEYAFLKYLHKDGVGACYVGDLSEPNP